jgi:hypothetical protein
LEVHQSFLDDLVDLVLSNEAEIFSSGDGENLSVPLRVLVLAEADKGSSFGVDSLDGLSSFADDQSDQSDRDFHFDFVRTVYCPAVHLSLGFNNEVELLPDSLDRFRVTLNENISGFGIGSTWGCHLHFVCSWLFGDVFDCLPFFAYHQTDAFVWDFQYEGVVGRRTVGSGEREVVVSLSLANALLVLAHLLVLHLVQRVVVRKD